MRSLMLFLHVFGITAWWIDESGFSAVLGIPAPVGVSVGLVTP